MELQIQASFECVFYINGEFFETAESVEMSEFDVAYITVLPLEPALLPYTVKLCGTESVKNKLAYGVRLQDTFLLMLSPKYPLVYETKKTPPPSSLIGRLFSLVKDDLTAAYAMLSEGLKKDIDKNTLAAFFEGYERIAECKQKDKNRFYLIDRNGRAKAHSYSVCDGFIDDIREED